MLLHASVKSYYLIPNDHHLSSQLQIKYHPWSSLTDTKEFCAEVKVITRTEREPEMNGLMESKDGWTKGGREGGGRGGSSFVSAAESLQIVKREETD